MASLQKIRKHHCGDIRDSANEGNIIIMVWKTRYYKEINSQTDV